MGSSQLAGVWAFVQTVHDVREVLVDVDVELLQAMPQVSDQELNVYMQQLSSAHSGEFDNMSALKELYIYIDKYFSDIMDSLDESPNARKLGLGHKLKSLAMSLYPQ